MVSNAQTPRMEILMAIHWGHRILLTKTVDAGEASGAYVQLMT